MTQTEAYAPPMGVGVVLHICQADNDNKMTQNSAMSEMITFGLTAKERFLNTLITLLDIYRINESRKFFILHV